MIKALKNKKAEGYIDVAVAVLVIVFVLITVISIWSMVTLKQDMAYMCNDIPQPKCQNFLAHFA